MYSRSCLRQERIKGRWIPVEVNFLGEFICTQFVRGESRAKQTPGNLCEKPAERKNQDEKRERFH